MCGSDPSLSAPWSSSSGTVHVALSGAHKGQLLPWIPTCAQQTHQSPTWLPKTAVGVASARVPCGPEVQGGSRSTGPPNPVLEAAVEGGQDSVLCVFRCLSKGPGITDMGCRLCRALLRSTSEVCVESFAAYLCGAAGHPWNEIPGPGRSRPQSLHPGMEHRGARRRWKV